MKRLSCVLAWLLPALVACLPSPAKEPEPAVEATPSALAYAPEESHGLKLQLHVVKHRFSATGEPPIALEVTLANQGAETLWLEHRLSPGGSLRLEVREADGSLASHTCRMHAVREDWDYLVLSPGEAIRRVITFHCFRLPRGERLTVQARYFNGSTAAMPPPWPGLVLFRGPLLSNTESFTWDAPEASATDVTNGSEHVGQSAPDNNWTPTLE